jgi:hypothetical protein
MYSNQNALHILTSEHLWNYNPVHCLMGVLVTE